MNKMIFIFILFLLFTCAFPEYDRPWYDISYKKPINYELTNIDNITKYVTQIIKYEDQYFAHHPQFHIDTQKADCDGFSLVTLAMIYKELGIKGSLLRFNVIGTDRIETHTCIKVKDKIYYKKLIDGTCTDLIFEIPFDKIEFVYKFIS